MTKVEEELNTLDDGYSAKDMAVLEGLEPVRKRPGMYIGSTGPTGLHHLVWEVVDNSVDEAMAGYCTRIDVTLLADGGCRVVDNGRGIPTDVNPQYNLSGVEIALTKLHGGGKFGGTGYKVSGGLHGVGVSVVNALSRRLIVEVDRDGQHHRMEFVNGGTPVGKLEVVGPSPRDHNGTTVTFWPDPTIFEEVAFRGQTVVERLQMYAFLNAGLEINFRDEREGGTAPVTYCYKGGIIDFVKYLNSTKDPLFKRVAYFKVAERRRRGRSRPAVEHRLQRRPARVCQRDSHHRGRYPCRGPQEGPHQRRQQVRPRTRPAQGEGREPPRRGHPGGDVRHSFGQAARSSVRRPDQGQARQHVDPFVGGAGHQREAGRVARGKPARGPPHRGQGHPGVPGQGGGARRPRSDPPQVASGGRRHARQAHRLPYPGPGRGRAVHRRRRLGRWVGGPGA